MLPLVAAAILVASGAISSHAEEVERGSADAVDLADVLFFDMDAAMAAEALEYEEQLLAFVFQGAAPPTRCRPRVPPNSARF